MASKDCYKRTTQVLPIQGTRDEVFPRQAVFAPLSLCRVLHGRFQEDFLVLLLCSSWGTVPVGKKPWHCPDPVLSSYKYNFSLCISKFACLLTISSISLDHFVLTSEGQGSAASEEQYTEVSRH